MANPGQATEDPLYEYKFEVCLDEISMNTEKSIECTIKFRYSLFSSEEKSYSSFMINPDGSSQIPGHFVFIVSFFMIR